MRGPFGPAERIAGQLELHVARGTGFDLLGFDLVPKSIIDNTQVRFITDDPVGFRVETGAP